MITSSSHTRGFTLIELMVSMGIFSIIMLLASVAYISLIFASKEVRSSTSAMDNLSMAVSSMARDIRTGDCSVPSSCSTSSKGSLTFVNTSGCIVTYSLVQDAIQKKVAPGGSCLANYISVLTDVGAIKITNLTFNKEIYYAINPTSITTARQLWTTIIVQGADLKVKTNSVPQTFSIETGATMRKVSIMP